MIISPALGQSGLSVRQNSTNKAVVIAGTNLSIHVSGGVVVSRTQFIAQGFALPRAAYASWLEIIPDSTQGQTFLIQLTDKIGPEAVPTNVLAQAEFSGGLNDGGGVTFFLPVGLILPAG